MCLLKFIEDLKEVNRPRWHIKLMNLSVVAGDNFFGENNNTRRIMEDYVSVKLIKVREVGVKGKHHVTFKFDIF